MSASSLRGNGFDAINIGEPEARLPFLLNWLPVMSPNLQGPLLHAFCKTDQDCQKHDPASYCEDGPGKQPVDVWNW